MKTSKSKKAYTEILNVLKKYKDVIVFDVENLESKSKYHLFGIELKEKYGLNINPTNIHSLDWVRICDDICISWYGKKYNRTISWSDDGSQPEDELLLQINYPTGAYIFSDDYPTNLFNELFLELKSFKPKYVDSTNHALYFNIENASKVFNSYKEILKKYHEINKVDCKKRQIKRIEDELKELKTK